MSCRRHRVAAAGVAIAADELLPNGWLSSERHLEPCRVDLDSNLGPAEPGRAGYLIASGLIGDPTAPVIGSGGATNWNS
jgi:hypothetical protein